MRSHVWPLCSSSTALLLRLQKSKPSGPGAQKAIVGDWRWGAGMWDPHSFWGEDPEELGARSLEVP